MNHPRPSICTASGIEFWPLDPRREDVRLSDIAHALSQICRFGGHTDGIYSVAQHSLYVVRILRSAGASRTTMQAGLLHDAAEAYLGDVPGPLKREPLYAAYRDAEHALNLVIWDALGVSLGDVDYDAIRLADANALVDEQCGVMPDAPWWDKGIPLRDIRASQPGPVHAAFMHTAEDLGIRERAPCAMTI